jgi:hypothetical protein
MTKKLRDQIIDAFRSGAEGLRPMNAGTGVKGFAFDAPINAGIRCAEGVMNAAMYVKPRVKKPARQPEIAPLTPGRGWRYVTQSEIRWRQKHIRQAEENPVEMWIPQDQAWDPGAVGNVLGATYRTRKTNPVLHP